MLKKLIYLHSVHVFTYIFYSEAWKVAIYYYLKMKCQLGGAKLIEKNSFRPKTIQKNVKAISTEKKERKKNNIRRAIY